MRRLLLVALLNFPQLVFAADPVISSASVSTNTLTVSGSNFGTNASPTPHRLKTWQGLTNGSNAQAEAQFDAIEKVNYGSSTFIVDNSDGIGGGSLRMDLGMVGVGEVFPHHEFSLPGVDYFFGSHFFKIVRTTSNSQSGLGQMKFYRAGVADGTPVENYQSDTLMGSNLYTAAPANDDTIGTKTYYYRNGVEPTDTGNFGNSNPTPAVFSDGEWHLFEIEMQMNTIDNPDGVVRIWLDNVLISDGLEGQPRTSSGQHFDYVQPMPGLSLALEQNDWLLRESRHYLNTVRARIFLGNASTHSSVTKKYFISSSAWSGTGITSDVTGRPTGYDWVYVVNENGEVNATGFAFTDGSGDVTATATGTTLTMTSGSASATGAASASAAGSTLAMTSGSASASGDPAVSTYPAIGDIQRPVKRPIWRALKRQ